ncbi:MAG: hypothetical protein IANPNBLG_03756 [Bryobacteraceae bacterium]|nr:hypothetical protein [Bryobacteraceae bacterium]MCC6344014.1 DUF2905 domain-containing protein [Bryobacterales bacterium]
MEGLGRSLVILGLLIAGVGLLLMLGGRLPFRIGRMPGDIVYKGRNTVFYFPLMTSLLISLVLSLVFWLMGRK